jgi:hypothetical protein
MRMTLVQDVTDSLKFRATMTWMDVHSFFSQRFRAGFRAGYAIGYDLRARDIAKIPYAGLPNHPQVLTRGIEVDEHMAPLLNALWDLGLDTQFSCQGDERYFIPHEALLQQSRSQIVFADFDDACKFARKTIELLESTLQFEGGIEITAMAPIDGGPNRAAVWFPPQLLKRITKVWVDFEKTVSGAQNEVQPA